MIENTAVIPGFPVHAASGNPVSPKNAQALIEAAARLGLDPAGPWATYNGWRAQGRQVPKGCRAAGKIVAPRGRDDGPGGRQRFGRVSVWHRDQTIERDDSRPRQVPLAVVPAPARPLAAASYGAANYQPSEPGGSEDFAL